MNEVMIALADLSNAQLDVAALLTRCLRDYCPSDVMHRAGWDIGHNGAGNGAGHSAHGSITIVRRAAEIGYGDSPDFLIIEIGITVSLDFEYSPTIERVVLVRDKHEAVTFENVSPPLTPAEVEHVEDYTRQGRSWLETQGGA